ncbi:glycosyltransferase family 4 protein [Paenibacillus taiwanensis]|uniref:glycosyltransferase family 4 protein n=1 Tax=Paenibacillus taiwanensis TaxID=401638 RepID=UPI0004226653|nr:glycosyltransferase family 4 protein [Paenibacillus taiwanensis]
MVMKILLATFWELPHLGGVWPLMERLAQDFMRQGYEVDILGNHAEYYHLVNRQLKFYKSSYLPLIESHLRQTGLATVPVIYHNELDRYTLECVASSLRLEQYDLIHTHDVISACAFARVKPAKLPLIVNPHGSLPGEIQLLMDSHSAVDRVDHDMKSILHYYRTIEQQGLRSASHAVTSSKWLQKGFVEDYGIAAHHISVFPYGMDTVKYKQLLTTRNEISRPPLKKVITFAGRLVHLKGIEVLIRALAKLKTERNDWICWIVGDGPKRGEYEQLAAALDLQQAITFWGARSDVPCFMAMTDIYVQPSLQDNQPLSVIEAQLAGNAVIVSNAGGLPEMVEHRLTGLIAPKNDEIALYTLLNELLQSEETRRKLGAKARLFSQKHWSIDQYNTKMMRMYKHVMRSSHDSAPTD